MKPGYWIGILAVLGAVIGYAIDRLTGWSDYLTFMGTILGTIVGAIIYSKLTEQKST